jgi:hypothetical protein
MYGIDITHWLVSNIKRFIFPDEYSCERITRTLSLGYESERRKNTSIVCLFAGHFFVFKVSHLILLDNKNR